VHALCWRQVARRAARRWSLRSIAFWQTMVEAPQGTLLWFDVSKGWNPADEGDFQLTM